MFRPCESLTISDRTLTSEKTSSPEHFLPMPPQTLSLGLELIGQPEWLAGEVGEGGGEDAVGDLVAEFAAEDQAEIGVEGDQAAVEGRVV